MGTVANLLAGTPTLYIAPTGEALPELNDLTPPSTTIATPSGNWTATGFTIEDYELKYTPEHQKIVVNEHLGTVKRILTAEEGSLSLVLAENDMQAFSEAINASTLSTVAAGVDQVAQDLLKVGDGTLAEKALLLVGTSPEGGSRVVHVYKAVQDEEVTATFSKEHKGVPVGFGLNMDTTKAAGARLFQIYDITAVATS